MARFYLARSSVETLIAEGMNDYEAFLYKAIHVCI